MPAQFRVVKINFASGSGPRTIQSSITFGAPVVGSSAVAVNGFWLDYTGNDRNLGAILVNVDAFPPVGNVLTFNVTVDLRDNSGNDDYQGWVDVLGMAEVA